MRASHAQPPRCDCGCGRELPSTIGLCKFRDHRGERHLFRSAECAKRWDEGHCDWCGTAGQPEAFEVSCTTAIGGNDHTFCTLECYNACRRAHRLRTG